MKKGCLIITAIPILLICLVIGYTKLFPKKPASEKTKKKILSIEYNKINKSEKLKESLAVIKFLKNNKSTILDSLKTTNYSNKTLFDLDKYNKNRPHLPFNIFNELPYNLRYFKLKIDNKKMSLINTVTDYENYLYIIHNLSDINNLKNKEVEKYTKTIIIENTFQYQLTIEDAFYHIDPNNFAPN